MQNWSIDSLNAPVGKSVVALTCPTKKVSLMGGPSLFNITILTRKLQRTRDQTEEPWFNG